MTEHVKDSHCSFCGTMFIEQNLWPRKCFHCNNDSYKNPIPIIQILFHGVRIYHSHDEYGILIQKRNINPKKGEWALPGGYINFGETWQQAAARELHEETGIMFHSNNFELENVQNSSNGNLLIFCKNTMSPEFNVDQFEFIHNDEVQDAKFIFDPVELAFPTHTEELTKRLVSLKKYLAVITHGVYL